MTLAVENARLYERERTRAQELEVRDRRKDEFLAVLAHELRAPLAPILSAMALLADRSTDDLVRRAREVVLDPDNLAQHRPASCENALTLCRPRNIHVYVLRQQILDEAGD